MAAVRVSERDGTVIIRNRLCEVVVDLVAGTWSGRDRSSGAWAFRDARFQVDRAAGRSWREPATAISWRQSRAATCFGRAVELVVTMAPSEGYAPTRMLRIRFYPGRPFVEIGWGVRNRFDRPIRVRNVEVLQGAALFPGRHLVRPRVLRSGAGAEPNRVEMGCEIEALNGALLTFRDGGSRRSLVAGGLGYDEFARRVAFRGEHGARTIDLAFWDPQGRRIEPGRTYWSPDTAYLDFVTADPFETLEAYGEALGAANNAAPNAYDFPTLCGWMVSTTKLGEGRPINNAVGLVEQTRIAKERGLMKYTPLAVRLEPDTYCYRNHGDTQQGWWDDEHWAAYAPGGGHPKGEREGSLRSPYRTFSRFCRAVAELGGIPFTYFQCSMPSNDFAVAHPDWMLHKDITLLHHTHAHHRPFVRYDYTHPGFRAHCLAVWRRLRRAGLKGVKFDYPETAWASNGGFEDARFTTTAAYRELFQLCRRGLGAEAFLHERNLGSATHENAPRLDVTAGIVDLQRVWGDASHFEAEMASRIGLRWYKSRRVFLYYPDGKSFFLQGEPIPAYRRRAFLTMIAFLSGRLEIGTSIGSMTDEMLHDIARVFPVLKGHRSPRPVDMLTGGAHPSVYVYTVNDSWRQVLLINNNKKGRKTVSAPLSGDQAETGSLGLDPEVRYHAFDFWRREYLGRLKGSGRLSAELRPGEVAMISVREVAPHPQEISTNRHLLQGLVECHRMRWSEEERTLSGKVDVIGGEPFVLTVACNGRRPIACEGAEMRRRRGLVELTFRCERNARRAFRLEFS